MSLLSRSVLESSDRETSRFSIGQLRHHACSLAFVAALLVAAPAMYAQSCSSSGAFAASPSAWSSPLDRRVSLHARDISLRDALDRVSTAARIRLSYTSEAIPLDSRVCASFDSIPIGEALGLLLRGVPVLPVPAGGEHVVLAPSATPAAAEREHIPRVLRSEERRVGKERGARSAQR